MNIRRKRTSNSSIPHNRYSIISHLVHLRDSSWSQSQSCILRGICWISTMWWIYVEFLRLIHIIAIIYNSKAHCIQPKWISIIHSSSLQDRLVQEENNHPACFSILLPLFHQNSPNLIQTTAHSIYRFTLFPQVRTIHARLHCRANQRTLLSCWYQHDSLFQAFN